MYGVRVQSFQNAITLRQIDIATYDKNWSFAFRILHIPILNTSFYHDTIYVYNRIRKMLKYKI